MGAKDWRCVPKMYGIFFLISSGMVLISAVVLFFDLVFSLSYRSIGYYIECAERAFTGVAVISCAVGVVLALLTEVAA